MKKVEAYQLSNGTLVINEFEAIKLQKELDFKDAVRKFADEHGFYENRDFLYNTIIDNAVELSKIFGGTI